MTSEQMIENVAANVSFLMSEAGLSVRAMSQYGDCSTSTIFNLMKGHNEARFSIVLRIASHFGVTAEELAMPHSGFKKLWKRRHVQIASAS